MIKEYSAGNAALRPSETGVEATAQAAGRIGAFASQRAGATEMLARETERLGSETQQLGRETGELGNFKAQSMNRAGSAIGSGIAAAGDAAVKQMDAQQISHGAAAYANLYAQTTLDLANTVKNADPNDPTVIPNFMQSVNDKLSNFKDNGFYTENSQKWAEAHVDALRQHFTEATIGAMSDRAAEAVRINHRQMVNSLSTAVLADPTQANVDFALASLKSGNEGLISSSPNLGTKAGSVRDEINQTGGESIVKVATFGYLRKTGQMPPWVTDPKYSAYINPTEILQFQQQETTVRNAARVDAEREVRMQKQQAQEESDGREGQYLVKLHADDPAVAGSVTAQAIANDFTLTREARERMIGIVNREMKPEAASRVSNATAADLITRMRLPIGDPNRIEDLGPAYDALSAGKLNKGDLKFVRDEFTSMRTPDGEALGKRQAEFIDSVKPLIDKSNPLMGKIDQSGHQQLYSFTIDLQKKVADYRKAGKDPRDLMDPSKPDYMGAPAALVPYQKPLQQSLRDVAAGLRGGGGLPAESTITGVQNVPAPVATSVPRPPAPKPPEKGFIKDGYEFLGGNPGEAKNWRQAGERS